MIYDIKRDLPHFEIKFLSPTSVKSAKGQTLKDPQYHGTSVGVLVYFQRSSMACLSGNQVMVMLMLIQRDIYVALVVINISQFMFLPNEVTYWC